MFNYATIFHFKLIPYWLEIYLYCFPMQMICTSNCWPPSALLPFLGNLILFPFPFPTSRTGAVMFLCFRIHFILNLLALMLLCLPCHWEWPCISLQWSVITSPNYAFDLFTALALGQPLDSVTPRALGSLPALASGSPAFFFLPGEDAPWAQPEPFSYSILQRLCPPPQLLRQPCFCFPCPDLPVKPKLLSLIRT